MVYLKDKKIGDKIVFNHKFRDETEYTETEIVGVIDYIEGNGIDCVVDTEFGKFRIGEWMIIK